MKCKKINDSVGGIIAFCNPPFTYIQAVLSVMSFLVGHQRIMVKFFRKGKMGQMIDFSLDT